MQVQTGQGQVIFGIDPVDPSKSNSVTVDPAGAQYTFETASIGFDPSTGRTPVETPNNYFYLRVRQTNQSTPVSVVPQLTYGTDSAALVASTATSFVVKAAPGFIKSIKVLTNVVIGSGTLTISLSDSASGVAGRIIGIPTTNSVGLASYDFNTLMTTGINLIVTASAVTLTGDFEILVEYR